MKRYGNFERNFVWACAVLLALIGGFNAWLIWLIFWR